MDIVLRSCRHIEVYHVSKSLDVDAACSDVGGHENSEFPRLEAGQGFGSLWLGAVAVDPLRVNAVVVQHLGQAVRSVLGAGEDQCVVDVSTP